MSDKKITQLTALTTVDNSDVIAIVDDPAGTPVTKKVTADVLGEYMSTNTHVVNAISSAVSVLGTPIDESIVDAKGDLIVGSDADTVVRVAVGSNNQVLLADSTQTAGVRWATISLSPTWDDDQNIICNAVFS